MICLEFKCPDHFQMITIFTIIFVAIMATAIRRYALFKAQHGAYVSDLEQLHASISLPDTIKMVFYLRRFSVLSVSLLTVWCFYYLGCQAMVFEYTFSQSNTLHDNQAAYANDNAIFVFNGQREEPGSDIDVINTEMKAYLETPAAELLWEQAGVDTDGFVLIPDMRIQKADSHGQLLAVPRARSQAELESWMDVHPNVETFITGHGQKLYLHLKDLHQNSTKEGDWNYIGPPEGEKVIGDGTFTSSYLRVQCTSAEPRPLAEFPAGVAVGMNTSMNMTAALNSTSGVRTFVVSHKWNIIDWNDTLTEKEEINGKDTGSIDIKCQITRPDVEMRVKCGETACVPTKLRYIPDHDGHQSRTPFDDDNWAFEFFDNFLWSTGPPEPETKNSTWHTTIERSMKMFNAVGWFTGEPKVVNEFKTIDKFLDSFSANLTMYINSYFDLGLKVGAPTPEEHPELFNYFTFHGALYEPGYRLHWQWIALDYFSATLLLAASIWSWWLRRHTLAPDIFGYVSSLTRDNPHVPVEGGSALSGIDRARRMKRVKIRIGDVGRQEEHGRVGIVYIHEEAEVQALSKDRKYF